MPSTSVSAVHDRLSGLSLGDLPPTDTNLSADAVLTDGSHFGPTPSIGFSLNNDYPFPATNDFIIESVVVQNGGGATISTAGYNSGTGPGYNPFPFTVGFNDFEDFYLEVTAGATLGDTITVELDSIGTRDGNAARINYAGPLYVG